MVNPKILVVESNLSVAQEIEEQLKVLGYTVCASVQHGGQAIKTVPEMCPDLVLIDINLEGEIKADEAAVEIYDCFNTPVVYLIDSDKVDSLDEIRMSRVFGHVFKPFNINQVRWSIEHCLYCHEENLVISKKNDRLATVLNSISDAIIATDEKGSVIFMNPNAESLTDWQLEAAAGEDITSIFCVNDEESCQLKVVLTDILNGETLASRELASSRNHRATLLTKSRQKIPIDYKITPTENESGEVLGVVIVFQDITEHTEMEAQLNQTISELHDRTQLIETVFDSMTDGIIVTDTSGNLLLSNQRAAQMFRVEAITPELIPSTWAEAGGLFEVDKKTYLLTDCNPLLRALRGEATDDMEVFVRNNFCPDGIYLNVNGRPLLNADHEVTAGVVIFRDTTKDKQAAIVLEQKVNELHNQTQLLETAEVELKQTVQELQEQTQLMETIFDSVSDGVVVTNEKGEFLLVNPSATQITGMTATETPPEEWSEVYGTFYPDKVTPFPSEELPLVHAMRGRVTDSVDLFLRSPENPSGVFINVSGRPLQGEDTVRGGVITFRDVTKIKETEAQLEATVAELQNQTQLMETIFNGISDGVVVVDERGQFIKANPAAEQMTGPPLEDLELNRAAEQYGAFHPTEDTLFPVDDLPITQAVNGIATNNVEMRIKGSGLEDLYLSVSGRPLLDEEGTLRGGVAVARDITELKRAENQLRESIAQLERQTQLMESIFNSISDGVVVADENGRFTMFNPSAERIVGMGAVEAAPDEWPDQYGLFFYDRVTTFPPQELPLLRALRGEATDEVEMFIRNPNVPDGVYISVNGRPLRADGGISGGVVVFRDVTERILAEEAKLAQAFAQGRLEIVEILLHNLGNAINSVTIGVNVLHENLADNRLVHRLSSVADMVKAHEGDWADYIKNDPRGRQVLPFILALAEDFTDQNDRLVQTLERVRDRVAHIVDIIRTQRSSNQSGMTKKNIHLREAILNALKLQQDSFDKRGIYVEVDCEKAPQEIQIQESQFHQMLVNLCKNSIEAIDECIRSGGLNETPRIEIKAYSSGDSLYLDVTDNGIGIEKKYFKRIFATGYTTKKSGTGLGLHSIANFVIGSGGEIYPLSEGVGKGTTMRIKLQSS